MKHAGKLFIAAFAIVAIALGAGFIWMQRTDTDESQLRLYGNVDIREVQLAFRQPGRIAEMMFDEGDTVLTGTRMAILDDQPYRDALAAADASMRMAQAELTKLRSGLRPPRNHSGARSAQASPGRRHQFRA